MNNRLSITKLARAVQGIYAAEGADAKGAIRQYLDEELKGLQPGERIAIARRVQEELKGKQAQPEQGSAVLEDFVRLLLGNRAALADASSPQTLEKLAASLNTVFDSLNEIIRVMNATLGGSGSGEETIRAVIGGDLESQELSKPLEEYLGQIKKAFLVSHNAFQDASRSTIRNILAEIDPCKIESGLGSGLKFGPLKKAEAFEVYEASFAKIKKWFESERFAQDLLREFEKSCQRSFSRGEGKS